MLRRPILGIIVVAFMCLSVNVPPSSADTDTLIMEHEEEQCKWCSGDSDSAYMNTVVVGNADTDANIEIVTGGTNRANGEIAVFEWDGVSLTEESPISEQPPPSEHLDWSVNAVTLGDATNDQFVNIVATGDYFQDGKDKGMLQVYRYLPGGMFITEANIIWDTDCADPPNTYLNVKPTDVAVANLDDDINIEVITASRVQYSDQWRSEIRIWYKVLFNLVTEACIILPLLEETWEPHISIADIDGDSNDEIVVVVDKDTAPYSKAHIYVYEYSSHGVPPTLEYEEDIQELADITTSSIASGNIDSDSNIEMVVAGGLNAIPNMYYASKIWVFEWDTVSQDIEVDVDQIWYNSFATDVWIGNADSDGEVEIVTSGTVNPQPFNNRGEIAVWHSTGSSIEQEVLHNFGQLTESYSVFVGDADSDGEVEIVTAGHREYSGSPDPAILEIWTWNTLPPPPSDDWPMFHHDMANTGRSWSVAPALKNYVASYTHTHSSGKYSHTSVSPVVNDGIVLTAVDDVVYAFDTSINYLWSVRLIPEDPGFTYATARSLAVGNDRVFYGTADLSLVQPPINGILVALDLQGNELWRRDDFLTEFPGPPMTPWGERLFAPTIQLHPSYPPGRLLCLDATDGTEIWRFEPGKNIWASVAIYGTSVFVKAEEDLYSIPIEDPNGDGVITPDEINWVFHMRRPGYASMIEFAGSPMVMIDHVFVGSPDGYLYSLPVEDPTPVLSPKEIAWTDIDWESPQLGDYVASTPAMPWAQPSNGALFVGANWLKDIPRPNYGHLYRLNPSNGQILATYSFLTGPKTSSPAVADGKVFIWADENVESYLYAFDDNLNLLWMHLVDNGVGGPQYPQGTSPAIADSKVFVGNGMDQWSNSFQPGHEGFIFAVWE